VLTKALLVYACKAQLPEIPTLLRYLTHSRCVTLVYRSFALLQSYKPSDDPVSVCYHCALCSDCMQQPDQALPSHQRYHLHIAVHEQAKVDHGCCMITQGGLDVRTSPGLHASLRFLPVSVGLRGRKPLLDSFRPQKLNGLLHAVVCCYRACLQETCPAECYATSSTSRPPTWWTCST